MPALPLTTTELEATTSPTPDLDHLLNRPSRPFAFAPFVATPSDLPTSHKSVARPHTSTTSPTTTRSRRTGRSSTRHRRWNSSSTVPTSILPPVSPHTKKTVQVEQQIDRPPSRASIRATVGSDTGSSSETNRTKGQQKTIPDYLWNIGEQFSSSEAPSAHMLPQRVRKKYKVVVDQAPPGQFPVSAVVRRP